MSGTNQSDGKREGETLIERKEGPAEPAPIPAPVPDERPVGEQDRLTVLLHEFKSQDDWMRQNESQRQAIVAGVLALAAALLGIHKLGTPSPLIPVVLILLGPYGILIVAKYWERFCYHNDIAEALRIEIAALLPTTDRFKSILEVVQLARLQHDSEWGVWRARRLRDHDPPPGATRGKSGLMQHWLWYVLFGLVSTIGAALLILA